MKRQCYTRGNVRCSSRSTLSVALTAARLSITGLFAAETGRPCRLVAHRGESDEEPENTQRSFELARERGTVWAVETDVHLTIDRELVCCHDESLKRTAGVDNRICKMTLSELKKLDFGKWKEEKFVGTRIPTRIGRGADSVTTDNCLSVRDGIRNLSGK